MVEEVVEVVVAEEVVEVVEVVVVEEVVEVVVVEEVVEVVVVEEVVVNVVVDVVGGGSDEKGREQAQKWRAWRSYLSPFVRPRGVRFVCLRHHIWEQRGVTSGGVKVDPTPRV